jgi:hypothetical protein
MDLDVLALPCGLGVIETFPLPLNEEETTHLCDSARVIRQALDELGDKP